MWNNKFTLVYYIIVSVWHLKKLHAIPPCSGGMYDLSAIAQTISRENEIFNFSEIKYEIRLPEGAQFYYDPFDKNHNQYQLLTFTVQLISQNQNKIIQLDKLYLCRPFDTNVNDCPVSSSGEPETTSVHDQRFNEGSAMMTTWKFEINQRIILRKVFMDYELKNTSHKTLILSAKIADRYEKYFNNVYQVRPLPILHIFIHNKYIINKLNDNRNLLMCHEEPYSFVQVISTKPTCQHHHHFASKLTSQRTKMLSGRLLVYTANEKGHNIPATECHVEIQHRYSSCGNFFSQTSTWSEIFTRAVSPYVCNLWRQNKLCSANNLPMTKINENLYRTFLARNKTFDNVSTMAHIWNCLNRQMSITTRVDCILNTESKMHFRFPFASVETSLGHINYSEFLTISQWIPNENTGVLIWENDIQERGVIKRPCLYTLLKEVAVHGVITQDLHLTNVFRHGIDENVTTSFVFIGDAPNNIYHVTNLNQISNDTINAMELNTCLELSPTIQNFMTDDGILLQFYSNNDLNHTLIKSTNIKYKPTNVADPRGEGSLKLPTHSTEEQYTILDLVCDGTKNKYTDKFGSVWQCFDGFPRMIKINSSQTMMENVPLPPCFNPAFESRNQTNFPQNSRNRFIPVHWNKDLQTLMTPELNMIIDYIDKQLMHVAENECDLSYILEEITNEMVVFAPSLVEKFIASTSPIAISKRGHLHGLHQCEILDWNVAKIKPSLRTSHPDLVNYNAEARKDLCYTYPVVEVSYPQSVKPLVGQLLDNNKFMPGLHYIHKCKPNDPRLFILGDTIYMYGGLKNDLIAMYRSHNSLPSDKIISARHIFPPPPWIDVFLTKSFSRENSKMIPKNNKDPIILKTNTFSEKLKDTQGIHLRTGLLESILARIESVIYPLYVNNDREEEQNLQLEDVNNMLAFMARSDNRHNIQNNKMSWSAFFVKENQRFILHIHGIVQSFIWFMNLLVIPLCVIPIIIITYKELNTDKTGPINAPNGAAIGKIDRYNKTKVEDKVRSKVQYIPKKHISECESDLEEAYEDLEEIPTS